MPRHNRVAFREFPEQNEFIFTEKDVADLIEISHALEYGDKYLKKRGMNKEDMYYRQRSLVNKIFGGGFDKPLNKEIINAILNRLEQNYYSNGIFYSLMYNIKMGDNAQAKGYYDFGNIYSKLQYGLSTPLIHNESFLNDEQYRKSVMEYMEKYMLTIAEESTHNTLLQEEINSYCEKNKIKRNEIVVNENVDYSQVVVDSTKLSEHFDAIFDYCHTHNNISFEEAYTRVINGNT